MRVLLLLGCCMALAGCFAPVSPTQRVADAARELNIASRFGQTGVAVAHVDASIRKDFLSRRSQWGRELRIADIELAGLQLKDEDHASVLVDVAWSSNADSLLRATRLEQQWENLPQGWKLVRERRISGDTGLFGEMIQPVDPPHPDVHLPSRTLRSPSGP